MFEQALSMRQVAAGKKIAYKTLVSAGLIALAAALPQIVHLILGAPGGVKWLPMYLPVLIGGCPLGAEWGLAVGVLSPLVSFLLTSALGNPMPAAARLPFMMAELAVFALVTGLFSKLIAKNALWAFPAVWAAQLAGRAAFLGIVALAAGHTELTAAAVWGQIQTGFPGLGVQAVLVPLIVIGLRTLLLKDRADD